MPSLAKNITKDQVETALSHIIENNISLNSSTRWYLNYDGKFFPPKEVVRWAARLAEIPDWQQMTLSGGDNTNLPLKNLGFSIVEKDKNPLQQLVDDYKKHLTKNGLAQELYKWILVEEFKGRPKIDVTDFNEEIRDINFSNLVYGVGIGVIRDLAKQKTEQYRQCYIDLYDENVDLKQRIQRFNFQVGNLFIELYPNTNRSHHHDERTIATILTYHNPELYGFYKDSFYQLLCQKIGEKPKVKNEKYGHYLSIMDDFISDYIESDINLIDHVNSLKSASSYEDANLRILAQDIFYMTLERQARNFKNIVNEVSQALANDFEKPPFIILPKSSFQKQRPWNWVSDAQNILSNEVAHYELEQFTDKGIVNVCLHFESSKTNVLFKNIITEILPEELEWFSWQDGKSIRFIKPIKLSEENLATEIINRLTYIDDKIGPEVKRIKMEIEKSAATGTTQQILKRPLNQILYGPPGTGKTYNTINKALEIIGVDIQGKSRKAIKDLFDIKVMEGRIAFTTFHQSMSYEDFVEGIKPVAPEADDNFVKYIIENGLFKRVCIAAQTPNYTGFNSAYQSMINSFSDQQQLTLKTPTNKEFNVSLNSQGNLKLHTGPDRKKNGVLTKDNIEILLNGHMGANEWKGYYSGVIEHLKSHFKYSNKTTTNDNNNYVLIIDEINRGNVSQIFGELITLIEDSKRIGNNEALKVMLPYSKSEFGIPNNLYIVGTMNTADRSVEALDTALRRRFSFEEMPPMPHLLTPAYRFWNLLWDSNNVDWIEKEYVDREKKLLDFQGATSALWDKKAELWEQFKVEGKHEMQVLNISTSYFTGVDLSELLRIINDRIGYLLDGDHLIGHSFFINVYSWEQLCDTFYQNIIPLLQEYFYGDFGKIELILGAGFISAVSKAVVFAVGSADYEMEEKSTYSIKSYKNDIDGFKAAIVKLMLQQAS